MAKFTAGVAIKLKDITWSSNGVVPAGTTVRIPDEFADDFGANVAPTIPGFAWVSQDESTAIPTVPIAQSDISGLTAALADKATNADVAGKYDKTGGTISGAVTVTGALVAQASVSTPALTATRGRFKGTPWHDVMAYGATGDGVTDDTTAIRAALAAAVAGETVVLPAGVFIVTGALSASASVSLLGLNGATLKAGADGLDQWVKYTNAGDFSIRGVSFDDANRARTIIDLNTCSNVIIEGCRFTGYSAASGHSSSDSAIRMNSITTAKVISCTFESFGGIYASDSSTLNRCITIQGTPACTRVTVQGCHFNYINQGIVLNGSQVSIIGNVFRSHGDNAVYAIEGASDLIVSGNAFLNGEECVILNNGNSTTDINGVQIVGNLFRDFSNKGVGFQGPTRGLSIIGNQFSASAAAAISYRPGDTGIHYDTVIVGNSLRGTGSFASIYLQAMSGALVANNYAQIDPNASSNHILRVDGTASTSLYVVGNTLINSNSSTSAYCLRFTVDPISSVIANNVIQHGQAVYPTTGDMVAEGVAPVCRVYNSANISVNTTSDTTVTFDSESSDIFAMHSSASPSRITPPWPGKWRVHGQIEWSSQTVAAGFRQVKLMQSGAQKNQTLLSAITNSVSTTAVDDILDIASGDYIELVVRHNFGSAININANSVWGLSLSAEYIGR